MMLLKVIPPAKTLTTTGFALKWPYLWKMRYLMSFEMLLSFKSPRASGNIAGVWVVLT